MNNALLISVPQRMPHVSRFLAVFGAAMERKRCRRSGGRKSVRRGEPFSRCAEGLKVKVEGCRSADVEEGEVVEIEGEGLDERVSKEERGVFAGFGGGGAGRDGAGASFGGGVGGRRVGGSMLRERSDGYG